MKNLTALLAAAAGAALTTYYFDPDLGARRRTLVRHRLFGTSGAPWERDLEARRAHHDALVRDAVRARLDTLVSHPGAIDVAVEDGAVRLTGNVLAPELDGLLTQVRDMRGVRRVINAMTARSSARELATPRATLDIAGLPRNP